MNKQDVIKYSLTLPNTYEDRPFPDDFETVTMKHCENKKWFVAIIEVKGEWYVNIKTRPEYSELLRNSYDYIIPGYHMNKEHWNSIILRKNIDEGLVKELIEQSYQLTKSKCKR